jgi:hypothetical protein
VTAGDNVFSAVDAACHGAFSSREQADDEPDGRQNADYGKEEHEAEEPGCRVDEMQDEILHVCRSLSADEKYLPSRALVCTTIGTELLHELRFGRGSGTAAIGLDADRDGGER